MTLPKWKKSGILIPGILTPTRLVGKVMLNKNGSYIDIWFWEGNKNLNWISVNQKELLTFLLNKKGKKIFDAQSDEYDKSS